MISVEESVASLSGDAKSANSARSTLCDDDRVHWATRGAKVRELMTFHSKSQAHHTGFDKCSLRHGTAFCMASAQSAERSANSLDYLSDLIWR